MKIKLWHSIDKEIIWDAQNMVDGKWNIGKLMQNKHIETCFSVGMTDKNGVDIYTDDIVMYDNNLYRLSRFRNGAVTLYNDRQSLLLHNTDKNKIEVLGSYWELNVKKG